MPSVNETGGSVNTYTCTGVMMRPVVAVMFRPKIHRLAVCSTGEHDF